MAICICIIIWATKPNLDLSVEPGPKHLRPISYTLLYCHCQFTFFFPPLDCKVHEGSALVFYCCCNKLPQTQWLKTTQILLSCGSVGQKSSMSLTGLMSSLGRSALLWRLQGRTCSLLVWVAGRIQFLEVLQLVVISRLMAFSASRDFQIHWLVVSLLHLNASPSHVSSLCLKLEKALHFYRLM